MIEAMPTPRPARTSDLRTEKVIDYFETLTPRSLAQLEAVYGEDAHFIDPFNDVTSQAGIRRVFEHMFASLESPRFEIVQAVTEADHCFLVWNFRFRRHAAGEQLIHGASHLRYGPDGRIALHRDYWDTGRELYEHLPLLGAVLRWLRGRLSAAS
jgi:steroid delta-isomerase